MNRGPDRSASDPDDRRLPELSAPERLIASFIRLFGLTAIGLVALTFVASLIPGLPTRIPVREVPRYWHMSAAQYVQSTHMRTGWGWIAGIGDVDVLNLASLALLGSTLIFCFLAASIAYLRERDYHYAIFCAADAVILLIAASGLL